MQLSELGQGSFLFRRFLWVWGGGLYSLGYYPGGGMTPKWIIVLMPYEMVEPTLKSYAETVLKKGLDTLAP
jgi:hypothetical protein